jgi:hypothetical protein
MILIVLLRGTQGRSIVLGFERLHFARQRDLVAEQAVHTTNVVEGGAR